MYNEETKKRFLEDGKDEGLNRNIESIFNKVEPYEERLNKDVSNFTFSEIIDMYKTWNVKSLASLMSRNSWLSLYTIWIIQQDLSVDGQNHYAEIDGKILKEHCINRIGLCESIISQDQVYEWLRKLGSSRDQFIILSVFEAGKGIDFNLQATTKPEDVTEEGLHFENRIIKISNRLRGIIEECKKEQCFAPLDGKREKETILIDNGYIYKLNPNASELDQPARGRNVYSRLKKILKWLDVNDIVSTNSLVYSGMIHWVNSRATELGISGEEYVRKYASELENQYGYMERRKNIFLTRFSEFLVK